jgi:hypothetical protein
MDTLDVLIAARAEVEKGWRKGGQEDKDGNVCALGAVWRVSGVREDCPHTAPLYAVHDGSIAFWNDDPSTTKADVLALFDRAIAAEAVKVSPDPAHTYTTAA